MRRIDMLIEFLMWATIAISVPIMVATAHKAILGSPWPWPYTFALCLLWLPAALSLGQLDGGPGPHSRWFYRFAILAAMWGVGVTAYGIAALAA